MPFLPRVTATDPVTAMPARIADADAAASPSPSQSAPPTATASPAATAAPTATAPPTAAATQPRPSAAAKPPAVVADASAFAYEGAWEHVTGRRDGRFGGKSSRTFRRGARASLTFTGRYLRLYGVVGPGGGFGAVQLDGAPVKLVDFFWATKAAHRLVYVSPPLGTGTHHVSLTVVPDPSIAGARSQYVNIDGAEYGS